MRRPYLLALLVLAGFALRVWFASWGLHHERFWDERYLLDNVRPIVRDGEIRLVTGYYPSPVVAVPPALLLIASEKLASAAGHPIRLLRGKKRHLFAPASYRIVRGLHCLYGALTIWLTFLVGRRLFGVTAGWIAAVALTFLPPHIACSAYFKPDVLLVLTTLWALHATLRAIERPTLLRYSVLALAIALAMSSKLTGGIVAVPIVVATAVMGVRDIRRLALLGYAGISSAALFVALNPRWPSYLGFLSGLHDDYARRALAAGMTRSELPRQLLQYIVDPTSHGAIVGGAALVAGLVVLIAALRPGVAAAERASRLAFISFPIALTAAYMNETAYFKGNNFTPVLPFTCVLAGYAGTRVFRLAATRAPLLGSAPARAVAAALVAALVVPRGFHYVYRSIVPTTVDLAQRWLEHHLAPAEARLLFYERWNEPRPIWEGRLPFGNRMAAVQVTERLAEVAEPTLARADGVLFPKRRLRGPDAAWYRHLLGSAADTEVREFQPSPFSARGDTVIAVFRPWHRARKAVVVDGRACPGRRDCVQFFAPKDTLPGDIVTLSLVLPYDLVDEVGLIPLELDTGRECVPLYWASARPRDGQLYLSGRFRMGPGQRRLRVLLPGPAKKTTPRGVAEWERWQLGRPASPDTPL